jgi:uncharacterized protein (TIGR02594 family)
LSTYSGRGVNAIGAGHREVTLEKGETITLAEALELFENDLAAREADINRVIKVKLTQGWFDAIMSFYYNTGALGELAVYINKQDWAGAKAFMRTKVYSNGQMLQGLVDRRNQEIQIAEIGNYGDMNIFVYPQYPGTYQKIPMPPDATDPTWPGYGKDVPSSPVVTPPAGTPVSPAKIDPAVVPNFVSLMRSTQKGYIEYNDQGTAVALVQKGLATRGYPLSGTGLFLGATDASVRDFQRTRGLTVDGQFGTKSAAALDAEYGKPVPVVNPSARPLWLTVGLQLLGTMEKAGAADNPVILEWAKEEGGNVAKTFTHDSIPWCALFANHCLTKAGLPGTETLWALDFNGKWPAIKLSGPAVGAFAPMTREGGGHIMIVIGRDAAGNVMGLSGNTSDRVSINAYPVSRLNQGYWWPKSAKQPTLIGLSHLPIVTTKGEITKSEA